MYREKGKKLIDLVSDYTVIDIEATSRNPLEAQIIELAALRVRSGKVVEQYETLVSPGIAIPEEIVKLTGITDEMVKNAPHLSSALRAYLSFIGNDVVIGHNITTYDTTIIYDKALSELNVSFTNDMLDTLDIARHSTLVCENYKLETLSSALGIVNEQAHRALSDCYAEYELYEKLRPLYDKTKISQHNKTYSKKKNKFSDSTISLKMLYSMLTSLDTDDEFSMYYWDDLMSVKEFIDEHGELAGNYPYDDVKDITDKINETAKYSTEALSDMISSLISFSDPVYSKEIVKGNISLVDKKVVLTGEFSRGSKDSISAGLTQLGAEIKSGVSSKTDILVVGSLGSQDWVCGSYGGKVKKAMELKAKGSDILVIGENDFFKRIGDNNE